MTLGKLTSTTQFSSTHIGGLGSAGSAPFICSSPFPFFSSCGGGAGWFLGRNVPLATHLGRSSRTLAASFRLTSKMLIRSASKERRRTPSINCLAGTVWRPR